MKKPSVGAIVQARCGRMAIVRRVEFYYSYVDYLDGVRLPGQLSACCRRGAFRHAEFWNYFRRAA